MEFNIMLDKNYNIPSFLRPCAIKSNNLGIRMSFKDHGGITGKSISFYKWWKDNKWHFYFGPSWKA